MIRAESIGNGDPGFVEWDGVQRIPCTGKSDCVGCCLEVWRRGVPNRNTRPTFTSTGSVFYWKDLDAARSEARRYFGAQS